MNTDLSAFYSALLLNFLATPAGIAAIFLAGVMAVLAVTAPAARWVFIAVAVWASTLPVNTVAYGAGNTYLPLAFPLEQLRLYARPLTLGFLFLLLLPLVTSHRGWRRQLINWPLRLFFVYQIGVALRLTTVDAFNRGPLSLLSFILLMLTLGVALSMWLQNVSDVYKLLYAVCGVSATVVWTTCYQLVINRSAVMSGSRLAGMTGNPQFLGLIIAFTLPTACFLLIYARRSWKPYLAVQIAVTVVLLASTGSRTGFVGSALGLVVFFHRRLGRLAIVAVVVGALVVVALPYFEGSSQTAARFLSTENTRAAVWASMVDNIRMAPWFGVSRGELIANENSYLSMVGQIGIVGALPFICAWLAMAYKVVRLQMTRSAMGEHQALVDLVSAYWVSVAVCAVFEGFLLGVLVFSVLMVYLFGAITTYLSDHIAYVQEQERQEPSGYTDPFLAAA